MATLPDLSTEARPTPAPASGTAQYEPPNWRQVGMAGQFVSGAGHDLETASGIVEQTNLRQDTIAANSALNKLHEASLGLELDPKTGFRNQRGGQAVGQPFVDANVTRFNDAASGISDSLQNDQQKALFKERAPLAGMAFRSNLLQHQAKETLAFNHQVANDTVSNGIADIAAHPYDDQTFDRQSVLIQSAIVTQGKAMGLDGDALASYLKDAGGRAVSKALFYRASSMLQDNPTLAADFYHKHELDFDPQDRLHIGSAIKTATDGQLSKIGGQQAYQSAVASTPPGGLPVNHGADFVKPYDQPKIDAIAAQVKAPSKFDDIFKRAGEAYNVSPNELKLRAVAESGLNPDASSGKAFGIMQFTPETAAKFGIDPKDPEQAIFGAAKLMAQAGGTLGGDMEKVDRTYYGGNSNAKGPNTNQYVDNLRAARAQVFGQAVQPTSIPQFEAKLTDVIKNAQTWAQGQRPGDQKFEDSTVLEATKAYHLQLGAMKGQEYATFSGLLGVSIGDGAASSLSDLNPQQQQQYASLSPEKQHSLQSLWLSNQHREDKDNKAVVTPENTRSYLSLIGQATNDPVAFKNRDIASDIKDLPPQFQNHVLTAYTQIDKNEAKGANYKKVLSDPNVMRMIESAKIAIPRNGSTANTDDYNALTGQVTQALDQFMEQNKRQPTQKEALAMVAGALTPGQERGTLWDSDTRAFKADPSKFYVPLPPVRSQARRDLADSFTKAMGHPPSDLELQQAYTKYKLAGGK